MRLNFHFFDPAAHNICKLFYVSGGLLEHVPVCSFKAALQGEAGVVVPDFHFAVLHFALLQSRAVDGNKSDAVVVRRAQGWKGDGLYTLNTAITEIKDFVMSGGACDVMVKVYSRVVKSTVIHVSD